MTVKSFARRAIPCAMLLAFSAQGADTGNVNVHFESSPQLRDHAVMISIVRDGQVVTQQETALPQGRRLGPIEPGLYDVRVEGDGLLTEVKRGVHVFAGKDLDLHFGVREGKGARVVEYASGGLSREEIAARLAKLDAAVKELQEKVAKAADATPPAR